jgi:kynureninase
MMGGVNYYTGQTYDMEYIGELSSKYNITYGLDLAHAVGNIKLNLHDWNVDFAVFCTYKYLNSGPGSVGGCYVHEKHADAQHQRFAGWWGHDKETRFMMPEEFVPIYGAESWQLSNPPILSLAAINASFQIFDEVDFDDLMIKRDRLTAYARKLLHEISDKIRIITPNDGLSGAQLSILVLENAKTVHSNLNENGVICDWREPNVIRVSFAPLYNSFSDIFHFCKKLSSELNNS